MPLRNQDEDEETLKELITNSVLTHESWEGMVKPETHALMEVVMNNPDAVDAQKWREWLVRRHGIPTCRTLLREPETIAYNLLLPEVCRDMIETKAFPLVISHKGLYLAVGRPQLRGTWERARACLKCASVHGLGSDPAHMVELEKDFRSRVAPQLRKINYR